MSSRIPREMFIPKCLGNRNDSVFFILGSLKFSFSILRFRLSTQSAGKLKCSATAFASLFAVSSLCSFSHVFIFVTVSPMHF